MKMVSRVALAALLAGAGGGLVLAPPALAKKEEKKGPGLKLSPEVVKAAQVAQPALAAKDAATAEPAIAQIEAAAKTDDDKYVAAALRYELEVTKLNAQQAANPNAPVNETVLAPSLDALIANPSTPAADRGSYAYRRGALAFNGKQFPTALQYFQRAKQYGYTNPDMDLQIAKAKFESGDVAGGTSDLDATITRMTAAGQKAPEDYYRYVIARSNAAKNGPQTMMWLNKYIAAYPTSKNWRDVIVTYGLQPSSVATLDKVQKIDLFRLMRASNSLADQNDYLEYAQSVNERGLPAEAQAVIKEGMAAGKIPATNTVAKEMLADATTKIRNDGPLAAIEKRANASADGKLAAGTADAYLGQGDYAKAATLYRTALQKGSVNADEVNTHLGIALARAGDKAGAQTAFAEVKTAPRSGIASLWTTWLGGGAAPAAATPAAA